MKKLIKGKRYDTDTAVMCGQYTFGKYGDYHYFTEVLYRKKSGEYFLYGRGSLMSKYVQPAGGTAGLGGARILPMAFKEAAEWAGQHLPADVYAHLFGEIVEADDKGIINVQVSKGTAEKLRRLSSINEKPMAALLTEMIEHAYCIKP